MSYGYWQRYTFFGWDGKPISQSGFAVHDRYSHSSDGWLYFGTHRGSTKVTANQFHYKGDWIVRCNPETGKSEVVVCGPVPKHCIPASVVVA